ncbi:MAG: sigma-70 family RNA polymerase sigma factor [Clostridia bacterium]|nr:sigma-70 family RNA polymerase sigma factor [Clostridia bacterium]
MLGEKPQWDKEWEVPEEEEGLTYDDGFLFGPDTDEPPEVKKLKRELEREALTRMELAARTEQDYREVVKTCNRLDANRERRERYHEVLRGKKSPPLEWNMNPDGYIFPAALNGVLSHQNRNGDFLDTIFYCPYDIHELVPQMYISTPLHDLPDDRKELLFLYLIEHWSTLKIAGWRGQSDRNIRKIRNTALQKIRRKALPVLLRMEEAGVPLTNWERNFLSKQGIEQITHDGGNSIETNSGDTNGGEGDEEIF